MRIIRANVLAERAPFCHVLCSLVPPKPLRDRPFCTLNIHAGRINFVLKKNIFSVSKLLEDLVNDASDSLDKICERLDTPTAGLGNYENVAKCYGYKISTIRSKFETSRDGPSKALILALKAEHPDVTVESFAEAVVKQAKRKDVAKLLREFDCK